MNEYQSFIESKRISATPRGMAKVPSLAEHLHTYQKHCVDFGLKAGSWGCFLDTGLGKTAIELEWAYQALIASKGRALILTPLAVARQIEREGKRWGYPIQVIRDQFEARLGINVCNYDRLSLLDSSEFSVIVLDESSIIKNFSGKTTRALIDAFRDHRWRMAATATPAPNDHTELGNHSEFLGVMPMNDMLVRWFINDTADTGTWRLKGHARESFWEWMSSWARMAEHPRDLGDSIEGYDLPPMRVFRYDADSSDVKCDSTLFPMADVSATGIFKLKRETALARAKAVGEIVSNDEPWIVWCDTDAEQDALDKVFEGRSISVRGSQSIEAKEKGIASWLDGAKPIMISKSSIMGFGLNLQFCHQQVFAGRSFSYESYYQAVRRLWRFGQTKPVDIHLVVAEGEDSIGRVIDRKADDHASMKREMTEAMRKSISRASVVRVKYEPKHSGQCPLWYSHRESVSCIGEAHSPEFALYHGDSVPITTQFTADSIDLSVYSPPFSNLFVYSDSESDMGNSANDAEFFEHYTFLIKQIFRMTKPGRLSAVHSSDLPMTKWKDGVIAIKDLSGMIVKAHQEAGWDFHSRITIWKDPVVEMQRTKALGLLHKQLKKDSGRSRAGMPDYLLVFRKPGDNAQPITHTADEFPVSQWQEWASPVWMDIDQTNVLNARLARENGDEKHLCPLQLGLIRRALILWSNPSDVVLSPFMGIGSEGVESVKAGRRFIGIELKEAYFKQAQVQIDAVSRQTVLAF